MISFGSRRPDFSACISGKKMKQLYWPSGRWQPQALLVLSFLLPVFVNTKAILSLGKTCHSPPCGSLSLTSSTQVFGECLVSLSAPVSGSPLTVWPALKLTANRWWWVEARCFTVGSSPGECKPGTAPGHSAPCLSSDGCRRRRRQAVMLRMPNLQLSHVLSWFPGQ